MKLIKTLLSRAPNPWSYPLAATVLLSFLLVSLAHWTGQTFATFFTASRDQVFSHHEYWRVFTTSLVHSDIKHFLSNAIFFGIFGFFLHSYFGFFVFPVMSLLLGGVINALTLMSYPEHATLMGASGVVYFMTATWATLYVFIERRSHILKRIVAVLGVSLSLFFPTAYEPQVSYLAHALGFALGVLFGAIYFFFNRRKIREAEVWREEPAFYEDPQYTASSSELPDAMDETSGPKTVH